jgi:uncharacterized protein (TIGR02996 family)
MDHAGVFLEAIREAPDDDAPRLIYADWLDEHGEHDRAAFIRAQVRLAALDPADPARLDLDEEARDLLAVHEGEWTADLPPEVDTWQFRRGFVEKVFLTEVAFLECASQLMASGTLRAVHLRLSKDRTADLAACRHLARVESLNFGPSSTSTYRLTNQSVQTLLASPHLGRLRALGLSYQDIGSEGVKALVQSPWLANLRRLDLRDNPNLGNDAALTLSKSKSAGGLEEVRLRGTNLTGPGIWALFSSRYLPALHTLDVEAGFLFERPGPRDIARDLLQQPLSARLTALDLSHAYPHDYRVGDLLPVLTSDPGLPRLASLNLQRCGIGDDGAAVLAVSPHPPCLGELNLQRCNLGPAGLQVLAGSPHRAGLTTLRLGHNAVRDAGIKALASSPHLRRLVKLDLSQNAIGGPGVRALASSANLSRLQELDLSGNYVGAASVEALAHSPHLRNLTSLALSQVNLEADGVRALTGSAHFQRLTHLELAGNQVGDGGAMALAASPYLPRLVELNLYQNRIGKAGAEALARSPHLRRLKRLNLGRNDLSDTEWKLLQDRFGSALVSW